LTLWVLALRPASLRTRRPNRQVTFRDGVISARVNCAARCTTRKTDGIRRSEIRQSWTTSANYVGLTVQPAELIQSIRPVVMYTIAPRCAPKTWRY
jgi:hypothetical protein